MNQETKTQSFILIHFLFLDKLIQLSNPQPELDFHYASRILTSNHMQFIILTPEKETKALLETGFSTSVKNGIQQRWLTVFVCNVVETTNFQQRSKIDRCRITFISTSLPTPAPM